MEKKGLISLGYVRNIKTYCDELNEIVECGISNKQINDIVNNSGKEYYNGAGYKQYSDGSPVTYDNAKYIVFKMEGCYSKGGKEVYGWFSRKSISDSITGVEWGTMDDFKKEIEVHNTFSIGSMYFDSTDDGLDFLEDIASTTIPETWTYKGWHSTINHPILKSYLENILERLIHEYNESPEKGKLIFSKNKKHIVFNSNLLDIYAHDVLIFGETAPEDNRIRIHNPRRVTSRAMITKYGFDANVTPLPPKFFDDVNEVVFQNDWMVDNIDFEAFSHIIEARIDRFPERYRDSNPIMLSRRVDDSIAFAKALAQRNYKLIVPMYRPQNNAIQLLMPIYLDGEYSKSPDFALVLTPDKQNKLYSPETILPLDAAYQNARLIAKPEEYWLNIENINM